MTGVSGPAATPATGSLDLVLDLVGTLDVDAVLFDIGGVLADDVWERMLLDPRDGLAVRRGIDRGKVRAAGRSVWSTVSRRPAEAGAWWAAVEQQLDLTVAAGERAELLGLVQGNPQAHGVLEQVRASSVEVGVVSNNTSFWWHHQLAVAGVLDLVQPELRLLSCEVGRSKSDEPGLLQTARALLPQARVLVVDDRQGNLDRAQRLGFQVLSYCYGTSAEGLS